MIARPDLLDSSSPAGLEVFQLTAEPEVPACHIYMEAQIFTPDSRRFLLHRSAGPHGSDAGDPEHRYLLCDVETGELSPVTSETGVTAPSISPDGKYFYYFVDETTAGGGRLTLKRRNIDGSDSITVTVIAAGIPGTRFRPSQMYPLSTISSDGRRLAISCFLGDGLHRGAPWGLLVFDLTDGAFELVLSGPSWCNIHPQYSRSLDAERSHDIMVQENHANICNKEGGFELLVGGAGADIHVIRDDGQHFRNLPWGRDGVEACQGHQCWRGRGDWAITSTDVGQLIEACAMPHQDHNGLLAEGARRNVLCRDLERSHFSHFATDIAGQTLITDYRHEGRDAIYLMALGEPGQDAFASTQFLLRPASSWKSSAHVHPFLSPDGRSAFFNSDESGLLQAYMIRNLI